MEKKLLDTINSPQDLRGMDYRELERLSAEIREVLIENVSKTGGHLSSNLGVVELTVALHRCFRSPHDMLLFDVGHQCYTHKLLTGRRAGFEVMRHRGGLSGFPCPAESAHDIVVAGHGSAAISSAVGLARAKVLKGEPGKVVVVIGDGAFTGGMAYEAINNIEGLGNLVIILNDNTMSISKNVGALAHYLTNLRASPQYYKAKSDVKSVLDNTPVIGTGVKRGIQSVKTALRKTLYHTTFFEEMGLRYLGPVDGHDLPALCGMFMTVRQSDKPHLLHVETKKGKGFVPAENNPGAFHGVPAFDASDIPDPDMSPGNSYSTVFGKKLARLGDSEKRLCAVTAAMKYGTGLQYFKKAHRGRFFDVGMAEEHAVTYAGGLAAGGMLPVLAIYSTFLQRGYDQFIHDILLGRCNVLLAVDRAGLVPADGETHQGIYDSAYLTQQPGVTVVSPATYAELEHWLEKLALETEGPRAIRYPRGEEPPLLAGRPCGGGAWEKHPAKKKAGVAIVTYGVETAEALAAAALLDVEKIHADVFQMVVINPIDEAMVEALLGYPVVLFAEEGVAQGGIGEHLAARLLAAGYTGRYLHRAIRQPNLDHAEVDELRRDCGLDAESLATAVTETLAARGKGRH